MDITATAGWTKKNGLERPYMGLDVSRNYFTEKESYLNFTFRVGGFWHKNTLEDLDILANLDFFSRLRTMRAQMETAYIHQRWYHRADQ